MSARRTGKSPLFTRRPAVRVTRLRRALIEEVSDPPGSPGSSRFDVNPCAVTATVTRSSTDGGEPDEDRRCERCHGRVGLFERQDGGAR